MLSGKNKVFQYAVQIICVFIIMFGVDYFWPEGNLFCGFFVAVCFVLLWEILFRLWIDFCSKENKENKSFLKKIFENFKEHYLIYVWIFIVFFGLNFWTERDFYEGVAVGIGAALISTLLDMFWFLLGAEEVKEKKKKEP